MDYLQYNKRFYAFNVDLNLSFKPYYKWITFNTKLFHRYNRISYIFKVLNLIINGLPSIHKFIQKCRIFCWTLVLNLIINGLPSILNELYVNLPF